PRSPGDERAAAAQVSELAQAPLRRRVHRHDGTRGSGGAEPPTRARKEPAHVAAAEESPCDQRPVQLRPPPREVPVEVERREETAAVAPTRADRLGDEARRLRNRLRLRVVAVRAE